MIPIPLDLIGIDDLQHLVDSEMRERRDLEFKRELPGDKDTDVREFLADVTAMANAQGGDLIYGIAETDGVAAEVVGLDVDPELEIARIESRVRNGTDPRLNGLQVRWVSMGGEKGAILLRVPASLAAPHALQHKGVRRFHSRTSTGKYEMDTHELRQAFEASGDLPRRLRDLHDDAVLMANGKDMPFAIDGQPSAVLSVIPLGFFREVRDLAISPEIAVAPHDVDGGMDRTLTLEGVLLSTRLNRGTIGPHNAVRSFALTHRAGRVDAAWTLGHVQFGSRSPSLVDPLQFEDGVLDIASTAVTRLSSLSVAGPWLLLATIQGIKAMPMIVDEHRTSIPAFRNGATLPDLTVERISRETLTPLFRWFWLLFGVDRPNAPQLERGRQ